MEKLYSTKEIAEIYDVSSYTITQNWCNKGLKFIRGKHGMNFKRSWVDQFIEEEAERQSQVRSNKKIAFKINNNIPLKFNNKFSKEMKVV